MGSLESPSLLRRWSLWDWRRYLFDSILAVVGVIGITALIYFFKLYPKIHNISIIYLLLVLPLASTRGRYAATLASCLAFLAFDFFIVPPIYTFVIYDVGEWIALFIFLFNALLTGNLAAALRQRAIEASRRERETRTLYDLMRLASKEEKPAAQLQAISQAVVELFAPWGVVDCTILPLDAAETLQIPPSSPYLFPLRLGQKVVGTLCLSMLDDPLSLLLKKRLEKVQACADGDASFLWTFLSQVAALLERMRFQQENMCLEILQRTDVLRAALLSSVSHDLRTPLTAIKAAASSLLQEEIQWDEEARRVFLQSIEQESDRLNRLVANLLDMSRIEEGALKPDKDWYSLKTLIQDVCARLAPPLKGRDLRLNLPDDLLLIELDYLQIDQVLTNLLENAMRYTPEGSPIEINAQQEGEEIILSVADRGPGIDAPHLTHVFDKFYRVMHSSAAGYPGGSGLGLAVCKGLVEAHGGKIWAEARDGGGLNMFVVLPIGERERIVL